MNSAEIREKFLRFFASKGHTIVSSSPLIPANDPTLMFTNSGMVQFKDVFLGFDKRSYNRAASVQACLRAGGKHNDLENVGYTARHHTFFEMLGNWSFGDYFKRESIAWGWELLTKVYGLPPERLMVTVYHEDDEAYNIWTKQIGLDAARVVRIGDNKGGKYKSDNFWMMSDTGPCGPCSEIFYDHGPEIPGGPPGSADEDGDRFIEIWNHVFMQFEMFADGSVKRLPAPCVDTGMGLERLAAILQGVHSNYEIDLFQNLIRAAKNAVDDASGGGKKCEDFSAAAENLAECGKSGCDSESPSLKVLADHIRACAFLVADGVIPGNEGRGYVLRRIIRRAIRHGYKLGARDAFFYRLVPDLVREMGGAYPGLAANEARVMDVLKAEETRFFATIEHGMAILEGELSTIKKNETALFHGETAFKLHDTYGFPLDLTADICREHNISVDADAFDAAMERQKKQARASGQFKSSGKIFEYAGERTVFHGYETLEGEGKVLALYKEGVAVQELGAGEEGVVVLDETPFYAESGGQAGDTGVFTEEQGAEIFVVKDTQKIQAAVFGHYGAVRSGALTVGQRLKIRVNAVARAATARNHSATHLLHKALREVLGAHVQQKGSLVDAEKTRFDFAHHAPMTREEIRAVEIKVNAEILANTASEAVVMPLEAARKSGAMMLFGEKYGEHVRVVTIGASRELCGGTHVARAGDIGVCKIVAETGIAAGVRRIEAVTGMNALLHAQEREACLLEIAGHLKAEPKEAAERVAGLLENARLLEKEIARLKSKLASGQIEEMIGQTVEMRGGARLLTAVLDSVDSAVLRETLDKLKDKLKSAIIVLASAREGKVHLIAGVTADLMGKIKAGDLVNFVARQVGGKGGGRPDMAQAGGTQPENLPAALNSVQSWIQDSL
ncbi:MAG: alanine--tRNA ligase [Zoogloeaceae bacterium]|jgi:alanyl-tRNA synthetase|nr:alanine--tRNA ligase [Zoogloeaceae bacterium]